MPTISMFYGILIRMYLGKKEHNPPHFHAYYQETTGIFDIKKCELIEGNLPKKQTQIIIAWALLRQDELLADWELAQNGETPYNIDPLK